MRAAGLGSLEWRVLTTLSDQPPMAIGQLAKEVLSQQPTVTQLVQRLVTQAWVGQGDDPEDQRRTLVHITAKGQHNIEPLIQQARAHETELMKRPSGADRARLKGQLRQLARPSASLV